MDISEKIKMLGKQLRKSLPGQSFSFFSPNKKAVLSIRKSMDSLGLMAVPNVLSFQQIRQDDSIQTAVTVDWTWIDVQTGERQKDEITVSAQGSRDGSAEAAYDLSEWVFFCGQLELSPFPF